MEIRDGQIRFTKNDVIEDGTLKWDYNYLLTYSNLPGIDIGDAKDLVRWTVVPDIDTLYWTISFKDAPLLEEIHIGTKFVDCRGCKNLKTVQYLLPGMEGIIVGWFEGCTSLTQFEIPAEAIEVCKDAFKNCTSLQYVRVKGKSVKETNSLKDFFTGCTALKEISFEDKEIAKKFWLNSIQDDPASFLLIETGLYKDANFAEACIEKMRETFSKRGSDEVAQEKCMQLLSQKTEIEIEKQTKPRVANVGRNIQ